MSTYTAQVERDGKFWAIYVPEVDRWTQARHAREIEAMSRDLVAIMNNVPADSFGLTVTFRLPEPLQHRLDTVRAAAERVAKDSALVNSESAAVAKELAADMPLRDVGVVLGISHQRAHQLVNS